MGIARASTVAFACVVLGAAAAACSGSFGQGTGVPQPLGSLGGSGVASPTPPPTSSSSILTYGESSAFQNLPEVGGYSGAIALPAAPAPGTATAAPAAKGKRAKGAGSPEPAPTMESIAIGATLSTVKPEDGPDLNFESGKGKKKRSREKPARALVYVKLLPTHDITLESYPRIALDVPREIASQYRDGEFGLALWNAGEKESKYRLAVAERDTASPPPIVRPSTVPAANVRPSAAASPTPQANGSPGARPSPGASGGISGPGPVPQPSATLAPQRILFAGTAAPLKLVANRPLIFALYALPHPSATPAPKSSAGAPATKAAGAPAPAASGAGPGRREWCAGHARAESVLASGRT